MLNFHNDQAAGLRRIMAESKTRVVSVLSVSISENQPCLLTNLAAQMSSRGRDVLILQAAEDSPEATRSYGTAVLPALADVANKKSALAQAVKHTALGFYTARLLPKNSTLTALNNQLENSLNTIFNKLAAHYEVVLVDTMLTKQYALPLHAFNEGEILIRLTKDVESIKHAYMLIKQICSQHGRRNFGIVVDACSDAQAATVFRNIAQAARRFLLVDLEFYGAIPADEHLHRAMKLGRAVTDAFPMAKASIAINSLAQRIDYQQNHHAETELASLI
jgi:flagellar biosynthesis protein FlhG